jgi:translation initiation factor IF-2
MRAADQGFDERKHGNLVEILRAVQRDGLVRLDRDRQGVLRVFQGPQLRVPTAPPQGPLDAAAEVEEQASSADLSRAPAGAPAFELTPAPPSEPMEAEVEETAADTETPAPGEPDAAAPAAEAAPRRRRKSGTAAPRVKTTPAARKPRARAATPRKKKQTTETE